MSLLKIHANDNVAVTLAPVAAGEVLAVNGQSLQAAVAVDKGHKVALTNIAKGQKIIKYGFAIGIASADIKAGDWVHTHNLTTGLGEILDYEYKPELNELPQVEPKVFQGYRRPDGKVGIRNEVWIIPTVGCVNKNAELIARQSAVEYGSIANIDGIYEFKHPYGCSQMGDDQLTTQRILANLVAHPNAGAVLVLGLGCENNNIGEFKKILGDYNPDRVKFLEAQSVEDEIAEGVRLIGELAGYAKQFSREECPASELIIGLKCGGSDGFSGITANPLVGAFSDRLTAMGGTTVLSEVPEMFGAETILMNRAINQEVFEKTVRLINSFKEYFAAHNQTIYENPSPGNKKGGISSLEDKSLGCTQKGGTGSVTDVLDYGEQVKTKGLNLLSGPGNDGVATTVLAAAGCHIILFTTGRGTPLGTVVPTVKVATNSELFTKKRNWMDFDAGQLLAGMKLAPLTDVFVDYIIEVASGRQTQTEKMGFREITIFKNGVTL
ncbi:altronate dehydratase family protein [Sporomusa sp.]|uniref:UxaA family hydrolase n=1 Tax=Sporomusa sp. TaxID=2078658 RepID=UPI002C4E61E7|nr:altronate dehydratase family protein [Sporomusa sp.]HWR43587.1 altronate dehydratase family protein [Sporomusa sp.]